MTTYTIPVPSQIIADILKNGAWAGKDCFVTVQIDEDNDLITSIVGPNGPQAVTTGWQKSTGTFLSEGAGSVQP